MSAPDPLAVRAYNTALKRHRDAAVSEAADLERTARRLNEDLRRDGYAATSDARRALHTVGMLLERLVALETLVQDAYHFTVSTEEKQ